MYKNLISLYEFCFGSGMGLKNPNICLVTSKMEGKITDSYLPLILIIREMKILDSGTELQALINLSKKSKKTNGNSKKTCHCDYMMNLKFAIVSFWF